MNRKKRLNLTFLVFGAVVISLPGFLRWQEDRQQHLNRQLIEAIKREDTPAALLALNRGAHPNCRDEPSIAGWRI